MKTIKIRKSVDFSENSKIYLHIGTKLTHIKGFGSFSLPVEQGEEFFASHLWTKSNKINYSEISDNESFIIKPRMGKVLAFATLIVFTLCTVFFLFTKNRWSYIPLVPIVIYVFLHLSILKDRYLIISPFKKE